MPGKQRKRQGNSGTSRSPRRNHGSSSKASPKNAAVGSDPRAAKSVGGKGDFGVPESGRERDRQYVSQETKSQDPGGIPAHSGVDDRVTGVGGNASGIGSSSGGDIDTDIIGVGTGGTTVSQAGPDDRRDGADIVTGDQPGRGRSSQNQSRNQNQPTPQHQPPPGAFVQRSDGDASTSGDGQGAAAATNPAAQDDDSFAGEISLDEASGADNSPSDRM